MTMNSFSPAPITVSSSKNSNGNSNNTSNSTTLSRLLPATARRFMRGLSSGNIMASSSSSSSLSDHRRGDTEFFASLETNTDLAFFHRREVEAGHLLGQGTFTSIRAVNAIQLVVAQEAVTPCDDNSSLAHDKQQKRLEIQATVQSQQQPQQQGQQPRYAIKQLTTEVVEASDPKTRAKAARELVNDAKFLARLAGHDNIVTLRGMTRDAFGRNYLPSRYHDFFILLDCLSPNTLADRIYQTWRADPHRSSDPDEDLIPMKANYAFQIAKALKYCHSHGVLYRNLQPTNVGFSTRDPHTIQLLDFGLARDFPPMKATTTNNSHRNHAILYGEEEATYRLTLAGTRRYLAGEVLTTGAYSWKSDVYSWAMTFYEVLCERKPYAGMSAADHQTYVCEQGNRPSLEDYYLPDELDEILTLSWHPRLADRWTLDEVCNHLQSFLMELDIGYYEQKEGEFLFDIEIQPSSDVVELLHEDEDWTVGVGGTTTMGERTISTAMLLAAMEEETTAADTTNNNEGEEEQEEDLRTSLKSLESVGADDTGGNHKRATPIRQKPRKVISSAA